MSKNKNHDDSTRRYGVEHVRQYAVEQVKPFGHALYASERFEVTADTAQLALLGETTRRTVEGLQLSGYRVYCCTLNLVPWSWLFIVSDTDVAMVEARRDERHPDIVTVALLEDDFLLTGLPKISAIQVRGYPLREHDEHRSVLIELPMRDEFGNGGVAKFIFTAEGRRL